MGRRAWEASGLAVLVSILLGFAQGGKARSKKPLRLLLSGWLDGQLEPCGCASAQSGGLDRRGFWLKTNKGRYDQVLEGGNLLAGNTPLERMKLLTVLTILGDLLAYPVLPLGPQDLQLGVGLLGEYHEDFGSPFVVTDLRSKGGKQVFPSGKVVAAGSYRLLVLSLVGSGGLPREQGYRILAPEKAVLEAIAAAGGRGKAYDVCALFLHEGDAQKARMLARSLPGVDLLLALARENHLDSAPEAEVFERGAGAGVPRTHLLFPGTRGRELLYWEGSPDGKGGWSSVALRKVGLPIRRSDKRKGGVAPPFVDPEIWSVIHEHKLEVGQESEAGHPGILEQMASQKTTATGARYAGSEACADCHREAYDVWKESDHWKAWASLVEREKHDAWPVTRHPECVACHAVGYGEKSGFVNIRRSKALANVGCESCHGPGSAHVRAFEKLGENPAGAEIKKALAASKLVEAGPERCYACHDFEQSPGFDFDEKWDLIEH